MNILITGDSHLAALDRALKTDHSLSCGHDINILPLGNSEASHSPYYSEGSDCLNITLERFQTHLTQLPTPGGTTDVIAISFLFHTLRIIRQTRLWQSYVPASLKITDSRHALSTSTFKKMVLSQQKYNLRLVKKLQDFVPHVIVLEGPRLFSHHTAFGKHDHETIIEVDQLYRKFIREELNQSGISIVHSPSETYCSATGLMKPQYKTGREADLHHANTEFGALMIRDLVTTVDNIDTTSVSIAA